MLLTDASVLTTDDPLLVEMRSFYRKDEADVLATLLEVADIPDTARSRAWERAREPRRPGDVDRCRNMEPG